MTQDEFELIANEFGVEHPFELGKRYGLTKDEPLAHMKVHNDRIFEEWVTDYAKRVGRPVSEVRAEVIRQRQLTAQHCNEAYRREVGITKSKEDEMAKKAANQTTIDMTDANNEQEQTMTDANTTANESKESTMTITGIPTKTRKNGTISYDRPTDMARHEAIRAEFKPGRTKGIEVTNCIPGLSWENFTDDPAEVELLGKVCKKMGWNNGVTTVAKALNYCGTPNPEYTGHGWLIQYKPYIYKTGERAGLAREARKTVVYPMEAFVWHTESGLPEFDEAKALKKAANAAQRELREAKKTAKNADKAAGIKRTTRRKTTSRKPKTEAIANAPVPMAAPAHKFHVVLDNGTEFWADTPEEVKEYRALFE